MPFAQFGVDADTLLHRSTTSSRSPPDQLKAFQRRQGRLRDRPQARRGPRAQGRRPAAAEGRHLPVRPQPDVRGIYDGPPNRDRRMCIFHWDYLDEGLKRDSPGAAVGQRRDASSIKCKSGDLMAALCKKIDAMYLNSDKPTRTQTEEAFGKMFAEMIGDLKGMIADDRPGGGRLAALRRGQRDGDGAPRADDRDRRAQGDRLRQAAGPLPGPGRGDARRGARRARRARSAASCSATSVDVSQYTGGFLPFFYVPWSTALVGPGRLAR